MKTWWERLLDLLASALTSKELERMGAGPEAMKGAFTTMVSLPSFGEPVAAEEGRQRAAVVEFMRSQLGKRYELGSEVQPGHEDEAQSWDCSESVEAAYRVAGLPMPDGAQFQYDACQPVPAPKPGDLGFLWSDKRGMIGHVMVCSTEETVIHAVGGRGVVEDPTLTWEHHVRWRGWRRHVDFARPPEDRV